MSNPEDAPTSKLAIAALVCGILGFFPLPVIGGIAALILGHVAHARIAESNGTTKGSGIAIAGFTCGYLSLILIAATAFLVPEHIQRRELRRESVCKSMRSEARFVSNAYQQYFMKTGQPLAPMPIIIGDIGGLRGATQLVAPTDVFEANGTFTLYNPHYGTLKCYVDSGDPFDWYEID